MQKIASIYKSATMLVLALASAFVFSGCATIVRGTKDVLVVDSQPSNAFVKLSNGMTGYTPASFQLPRDATLTCLIEKEGYKPSTVYINHMTARSGTVGVAGNLLSWGIIGAGVDVMSGATQDLTPNPVFVELEPLPCYSNYSVPSCSTSSCTNWRS